MTVMHRSVLKEGRSKDSCQGSIKESMCIKEVANRAMVVTNLAEALASRSLSMMVAMIHVRKKTKMVMDNQLLPAPR